jgi:hypothetical protein
MSYLMRRYLRWATPWSLEHPDLFELDVAEVVERALAAAEQGRDDVELELVDQPGGEVLTQDAGAAPDGHVKVARRDADL